MKKYLYPAGSIRGKTYEEANEWRKILQELLWHKMILLNPLRGKEELKGQVITLELMEASTNPLIQPKGVVRRDLWDIRRCDAMIVNLLDAEEVFQGTIFEMGFAHALLKPIVVMMEDDNIHYHPFVTETASFVVPTLEEAVDILSHLFE